MTSSKRLFEVPPGKTVTVKIIDSTSYIKLMPWTRLLTPPMSGLDKHMPEIPTWSFLIEHDSGRKVLFDLGLPGDWKDMAPAITSWLKASGWEVGVEKDIADILKENSVDPASIEAIVWSHHHFDHIGDPKTFPPTTKLIVGPGFKQGLLPAYPTNQKSTLRDSDFEGRELQEITFQEPNTLKIGQFRSHDYFSDGSFYLLDTPGHTIGHLAGLIRTTRDPDTFILCGGDLTHHASEIRPSPFLHLPHEIPASILSGSSPCPGSLFEKLQTSRSRKIDEPFFDPAIGYDVQEAIRTIRKAQHADADDHVLYLMAHDTQLRAVGEFFPKSANEWKSKGWREKLLWAFLEDFKGVVEKGEGAKL